MHKVIIKTDLSQPAVSPVSWIRWLFPDWEIQIVHGEGVRRIPVDFFDTEERSGRSEIP
jgi:hypothetical protein